MSNNVHIDPLTSCVICHKSEQSESNAGEVFKVNTERTCRHKFCESCTQEQFRKMGRKFKCPYPFCNSDVSREKLKQVNPLELEAESDNSIRRIHKAIFNKNQEDFATLEAYWEYQEKFETIVYNLVHGIDVEATKQEVERYKQQNRSYIASKNAQRDGDEDLEMMRIREELKNQEESDRNFERKLLKEKQKDEKKRERANRMALLGYDEPMEAESDEEVESNGNNQGNNLNQAEQKDNILFVPETHPLVMLLRKFPPPQMSNQQPTKTLITDDTTRTKLHLAGGYDYRSIFHARNISEMKHQLEDLQASSNISV